MNFGSSKLFELDLNKFIENVNPYYSFRPTPTAGFGLA
jgi:hypothetical protein